MAFITFVLKFVSENDKKKVMDRGPWSVKGSHVIIKEWDPNTPFDNITFDEIFFWIKVHSFPPKCINEENVAAPGHLAGRYIKSDLFSNPMKSFKCGFFHDLGNTERIWISFKYERLSEFVMIVAS